MSVNAVCMVNAAAVGAIICSLACMTIVTSVCHAMRSVIVTAACAIGVTAAGKISRNNACLFVERSLVQVCWFSVGLVAGLVIQMDGGKVPFRRPPSQASAHTLFAQIRITCAHN